MLQPSFILLVAAAKHCVSCVLPALGVSFLGFKPSGLHALYTYCTSSKRLTYMSKDGILLLCRRGIKPSDTGSLRLCGMRLGDLVEYGLTGLLYIASRTKIQRYLGGMKPVAVG
jgi:hypothetical protein